MARESEREEERETVERDRQADAVYKACRYRKVVCVVGVAGEAVEIVNEQVDSFFPNETALQEREILSCAGATCRSLMRDLFALPNVPEYQ